MKKIAEKNILENLKAGLTVALVSIPLSIAIAIASGAGPVAGIITGFWATVIAGIFASSNYNIIGPAGALTSILFGATLIVPGKTSPWVLPVLAVMSGIIILLIYALKGERFIKYIPGSVIHGFAGGVAFVIASTQLRDAFGLASVYKATGHFFSDMELLFANLIHTNVATLLAFVVFFLFLFFWKKYVTKIPGVIPVTLIGIGLGFWSHTSGILKDSLPTILDRYGDLSLSLIGFPDMSSISVALTHDMLVTLFPIALVVAIISILETLITARIADQMTNTRFSSRKETFGLGLSNLISGFMGGLPATGVFIRTGLNIKSGATDKISAVFTGLITGIGALMFFPLLKYMPMVAIASILCMTALGLIDIPHFKHLYKHSRADFLIALGVIVLVLFFDPGIAVAIGVLAALLLLIEKTTDGRSEIIFNNHGKMVLKSVGKKINFPEEKFDTVVYSLTGFISYIDAQTHSDRLAEIAKKEGIKNIILRMRNLDYCDDESIQILGKVIQSLQDKNIQIYLSSIGDEELRRRLESYTVFEKLMKIHPPFERASDAVTQLGKI